MQLAYLCRPALKGESELSLPVLVSAKLEINSFVVARWSDDVEWDTSLTVGRQTQIPSSPSNL
jgi:hypothetical protein